MGAEEASLAAAIDAANATATVTPEIAPPATSAGQTVNDNATAGRGSRPQAIPYERFAEVVAQKNQYEERFAQVQNELDQRNSEIGKMVDLIAAKDRDAQLVAEIRRLSENPKWRDTIAKLDKAIQGIEDDVEEGKTSPETGDKKILEELQRTKAEVAEKLADAQADQLLTRADQLATKYMESLPEEYTVEDKRVISRLLVETVNWDLIEQRPELLVDLVAEGFQEAININGRPRGIVYVQEPEVVPTPEVSTQRHLDTLLSAEWGRTQSVERGGKTVTEPVVSDGDFKNALAAALREMNRR